MTSIQLLVLHFQEMNMSQICLCRWHYILMPSFLPSGWWLPLWCLKSRSDINYRYLVFSLKCIYITFWIILFTFFSIKIWKIKFEYTLKLVHYLFQYSTLSTLYAIILIAIYIVFTIIEIVRLYLGFLGNLTERVSNSIILLYAR